ncbi:MAG: hypothetical protein OEW29_16230 [Acidimicrobiia bacterium]|nr:hypothetical protein [Acidimicrobiia bacterium]MDH4365899.1 hypothetical protein [Acidimicrobiia bacterium]
MSDLSQYNPVEYVQTLIERIAGGDTAAVQELRDADVSDADVKAALEKVTPVDAHDAVADGYDAAPDGIEGKLDYIQGLIDNNQIANNVDQSQHVDAYEVHGDVVSDNDSNVANATGVGSIAGEDVYGNQSQTGDGQQVGGDSGVQNQGDNSGQQAGYDAHADNVTSGDNNTVGSDWASRVGQGQVSQDGAYIDDSAQAFGEGSVTNEANDSYDSHDTYTETATATDSFNSEYQDNDTQTQIAETHDGAYGETDYEPTFEHDDYKGDDHHYESHEHDGGHFDVDIDDHSIDQDAFLDN